MVKKLRERTKVIDFKPFPFMLKLVVSNDIYASIERLTKKHGLDAPQPDMGACVYGSPESAVAIMFMPEDADIGWIAHESSHVIWFMLHFVGAELDNEVLAYYIGDLSRTVAEVSWGLTAKQKKCAKLSRKLLDKSK